MSVFDTRTRFKIFYRDDFTCQYCGAKPPETELQADHIVPVSLGGANKAENGVTACRTCNGGKGNLDLVTLEVEPINEDAAQFAALLEAAFAARLEHEEGLVEYHGELYRQLVHAGFPKDKRHEFWTRVIPAARDWYKVGLPTEIAFHIGRECLMWAGRRSLGKKTTTWSHMSSHFLEEMGRVAMEVGKIALEELREQKAAESLPLPAAA